MVSGPGPAAQWCSGAAAAPAERGDHPPRAGSSSIDTSQALGIVLLPWDLVRLAGRAFWVWASLTHRPQVWDPFPSARLGIDSLGDTDASTRTETTGSERPRQAHRDTCPHTPTLPHSLLLAPSPFWAVSSFPTPSFHKRAPHTQQAGQYEHQESFLGLLQRRRAGAEVGSRESSTTVAMEHQPSPSENFIPSLARGRQND